MTDANLIWMTISVVIFLLGAGAWHAEVMQKRRDAIKKQENQKWASLNEPLPFAKPVCQHCLQDHGPEERCPT